VQSLKTVAFTVSHIFLDYYSMEAKPVLIVGAGPVGLSVAAWLSHFNIPVRIIDSNSGPTSLSKALILWRRSLISINPLIPLSHWLSVGTPVQKLFFANQGRIAATLDLSSQLDGAQAPVTPTAAFVAKSPPSSACTATQPASTLYVTKTSEIAQSHYHQRHNQPYQHHQQQQQWEEEEQGGKLHHHNQPHKHHQQHQEEEEEGGSLHEFPAGILVPQSAIEAAFVHLLQNKHNISIERNTSLTSFTVNSTTHEVHCELSNGTTSTPAFVIGCDGAHSTVRKHLGLKFQGTTLTQRWILADVGFRVEEGINPNKSLNPLELNLPPCCMMVTTSPIGTVALIPIGREEEKIRVVWHAGEIRSAN
jgi:2-polyprenyl-6-methoxyphenol hydroxylase-like FAD-dependent oxidoreductase